MHQLVPACNVRINTTVEDITNSVYLKRMRRWEDERYATTGNSPLRKTNFPHSAYPNLLPGYMVEFINKLKWLY